MVTKELKKQQQDIALIIDSLKNMIINKDTNLSW